MKRKDQIIETLGSSDEPWTVSEIALALSTTSANLGSLPTELVADGLATLVPGKSPKAYVITPAGKFYLSSPEFGQDRRQVETKKDKPAGEARLVLGIFTSGEMHIEANGKRLVLTRAQASELAEFVCSLPNRLLSDGAPQRPPLLSALPSRSHRIADGD